MIRAIKIKEGLHLVEDSEPEFKKYKDFNLQEKDLEELLRKNIDILVSDETMLVVGQQLTNSENGRSDLIAIDENGDLVLIEIKRDSDDSKARKETFEFQAIRYAASLSTIKTPEELVDLSFAKYIENHKDEFEVKELTSREFALRVLKDFIDQNNIKLFNEKQRIALVASSFERQTESAVSWLISNGVDISCYSVSILEIDKDHFLDIQKILPPQELDSFLVDIKEPRVNDAVKPSSRKRNYLPRMNKLFEWGIIKPGDFLIIKNKKNSRAKVIDQKEVEYNEKKLTYNQWGELVTGWSSICIYEWAILEGTDKTLDYFRRIKLEEEENEAS